MQIDRADRPNCALREQVLSSNHAQSPAREQLQHQLAHENPRAHRLDADDGDDRHDLSMGQWEQHDPGREIHRHREGDRQRVHRTGDDSDLAIWQGCRTGYPTKACTFDGGHVQNDTDAGTNVNWIPQES